MSNFVPNETQAGYIRTRQRPQYAVIFDPCTPVFRAQIAVAPTGPSYLQLEYENVSLGDYEDIRTGMTVIISETADHTNPIAAYEDMRVSRPATADFVRINEYDLILEAGWYITVLNTYKPLPKRRLGAKVDGHLSFQGQTATIENLPSVSFVLSDDTGVFNLSPEIVTLDGSTVVSTLYDIPDAVYLDGTDEDLEIEIEMPFDSHTWGRLTYTLSSGVSEFMVFQLIVSPIVDSDIPTVGIQQPHIIRNTQGHHATCRAVRGMTIAEVMNGTRCVIVVTSAFDGGVVPIDPVAFVGYLTKEGNATTSASEKSASFEIASIWERAGQLPMHHIAIRDKASPAAWDEINLPTPQRVANHVLSRYSTVLNLCGLNVDDAGNTWYAGDYNLSSDSIGDAIEGVLEEINAAITQKPSGELFLRRDLRYETDTVRDAADIVWTLTNRDLSGFDYTARHEKQTGRTIIGVRSFYTNRSPSKGGKAAAPSIILGTSPTTTTEPNQLMPADKTPLQLFGDSLDPTSVGLAEERAGHIQAAANAPYEFSGDAWSGLFWLNANNFQWVNVDLAASLMTRGRAITGRHLLVGVELDLDLQGTPITRLELTPETRGGGGFVVGDLVPDVAALDWTVTPIQQPYSGYFGAPGSWNTDEFPPFTQDNMGGMGFPIPQDQQADQARRAAPAGTRSFAISFAESVGVQAGFVSTLGALYTINMQGSAIIQTGQETINLDFKVTDGSPEVTGDMGDGNTAAQMPGVGYIGTTPSDLDRVFVEYEFPMPTNVISVTFYWDLILDYTNDPGAWVGTDGSYGTFEVIDVDQTSHTRAIEATVNSIRVGVERGGGVTTFVTNLIALVIVIDTGEGVLYGDGAGYTWQVSEEEENAGEEINITYNGDKGLYIQNAPIASPPLYNESHTYTVTWEGDGSNPEMVYRDGNYADNQRVNLNINVAGVGAGA